MIGNMQQGSVVVDVSVDQGGCIETTQPTTHSRPIHIVDGVIHYVQAFCHRGIGDIVFRSTIKVPILTLEGNAEFYLNGHIRTRIEAFLDMIERKKKKAK